MPQPQIPTVLNNFSAYAAGNIYLGVSDVDLPDLEAMTETVSGAGIAGEIDSPILGAFASMTTTLNWRTLDRSAFRLARQEGQALDFRGSIQVFDATTSTYKHASVKVTIRALPKNMPLGSLATGSTMDSSNELEVTYIKILLDGETVTEIDKFNMICIIDGVDYLAEVRKNLGM